MRVYCIAPRTLLLLSHFSRVRLCETPWTAPYQASPSMAFSRQEHWSGLPSPSPQRTLLNALTGKKNFQKKILHVNI